MTTFALVAGMMPVAVGVGEGGEFYRPMAVAIIGGTITSTLLTLLVIPSFYDSIEIARERALLKAAARAELYNPLLAFLATLGEALLTLTFMRFLYRAGRWVLNMQPVEHPVERAARLKGFAVPAGFNPRPAPWQRQRRVLTLATSS
jgi:HAE1 family hydrophobic/amphiphilic exporter-1